MDDAREVSTKGSLNRQADAKAGADQAFDAFAAYVMSHHFWPVCWRGKFGDNEVMNLMSGITSAQQKRFSLEVGPMNDLVCSQPMAIRQDNQKTLAPKRHRFGMRKVRFAGHDSDVDCAVAQSSAKTGARSFYHSKFELRKSPRIIHERRAQIAGCQ
jgi:hypothetical protein